MIRHLFAGTVLVAASLLAGDASADISRGCSGALNVSAGNQTRTIATFEGRAHCKNKLHANDCRERAHDAIMACVRDAWAQRGSAQLPAGCVISTGGRPWATLTWTGDSGPQNSNKLVDRIRWAGCCALRPHADTATLLIGGFTKGDKRCGGHKGADHQYTSSFTLKEGSVAECSKYRAAGLCN